MTKDVVLWMKESVLVVLVQVVISELLVMWTMTVIFMDSVVWAKKTPTPHRKMVSEMHAIVKGTSIAILM
jgi:hypothetical protein